MLYRRVLITGANGLLGQQLVRLMGGLPQYDVLATGRESTPRFRGGSCGYSRLDITDSEDLRRTFLDFAPDVVVNCAALTQVDDCEEDRSRCWAVNTDAVAELAELCRTQGTRLIQVSTDFVFSGEDGPYEEDARPDPVNYYGRSKLAAENHARAAGLERWSIARTVLVYGAGRNLARSNIVLWLINTLSRGETVNMVTDQFRTPTYAPDLADGIERIVRFGKSGVFHLSGREYMSIHEMATRVAEFFGFDSDLVQPTDASTFTQPAERPPKTGFIILKAETELGFKPRSFEESLAHLARELGYEVPTS
ncbi:MAG: SDR family oxidoreductase [Rhodothermales bacterium]|nr:SDR family oxidoreductase [Rhodothermales bacterium]